MDPGEQLVREGNPQDFNIGHLNICGAIKKKLHYLKHILVAGSYDIFGVTEIHLSETEETDIGITGYYVIAYPSPYGITNRRGIAIYIKDTLSVMKMHIAPQKQERIEMVNVTFNYSATKQLKIIFLYRPEDVANIARFRNILKESSKVQGVESIIMGDMNINWLKDSERFHIHGLQQLVNEVTRQTAGTAIDHIWITKGIINLLKCDEEKRNLLNRQEIIDVLSHNQLSLSEEFERLTKDRENLLCLHQCLNCVPSYPLYSSHQAQCKNLQDRGELYRKTGLEGIYSQQREQLNAHLHRELPEHQTNRQLRVDQYSNTIIYKIATINRKKKGISMSDHCIIRISLKRPEETGEAGAKAAAGDAGAAGAAGAAVAAGAAGAAEGAGAVGVVGAQTVDGGGDYSKATYLKIGYLHIGKDTEASNTLWGTLLTNEDFDVFAVTRARAAESEDVPDYSRWLVPTSDSQLLLFVKNTKVKEYGDSVKVWDDFNTNELFFHISLTYRPDSGLNRKQVHMLFHNSQAETKVTRFTTFVQMKQAQVKKGYRFLVFANLDISTTSNRQPPMFDEMTQINPRDSVTGRYSDLLWVDKQTLQKIGESGAQDVLQSTNQLIWCKLNIDNLRFVKPR